MSILRRVFYNLKYQKQKTAFIILIYFIISTTYLLCVNIKILSDEIEENIKNGSGGSLIIRKEDHSEYAMPKRLDICEETVQLISQQPGIGICTPIIETAVVGENVTGCKLELSEETPDDTYADCLVIGTDKLEDYEVFADETYRIVQGNYDLMKQKAATAVSIEFATVNHISIGDEIILKDKEYEGKTLALKIAMIFEPPSSNILPYWGNPVNHIFTSVENVKRMTGQAKYVEIQVELTNPERAGEIADKIEDLNTKENLRTSENTLEYQQVKLMLGNIKYTSDMIIVSVLILGGIVIALLVIMSLHEQKYECRILKALGEHRIKIAIQSLLFWLCPCIAALVVSIIVSHQMFPLIENSIVKEIIGYDLGKMILRKESVCQLFLIESMFLISVIGFGEAMEYIGNIRNRRIR